MKIILKNVFCLILTYILLILLFPIGFVIALFDKTMYIREAIEGWLEEFRDAWKKCKNNIIDHMNNDTLYRNLVVTNNNRPKFETFEDAEKYLRGFNYMEFIGLPDEDEENLKISESTLKLIEWIFYYNLSYTSKRRASVFGKYLSSGNSDIMKKRNRSVIDIYLLAIRYQPETTLRNTYFAIGELLALDSNMTCLTCNEVNRRVYNKYTQGQLRTTGNCFNYVIMNGVDELGVRLHIETGEGIMSNKQLIFNFYDHKEAIEKFGSEINTIPPTITSTGSGLRFFTGTTGGTRLGG